MGLPKPWPRRSVRLRQPKKKHRPGLSITGYNAPEPTIASRRVAILVGDGYDPVAFDGVYAALEAAKAFPFVIGPRRQPVLAEGETKGTYILGQ